MSEVIDLRSDTVTKPSAGMRAAIAAAPVGDDQFGEDPTVNLLQQRAAELLGKEAALWLPTGTMANQVALRSLTRPGDDVIASRDAHVFGSETGGAAANSGVQGTLIGEGGVFRCEEFLEAVKPRGHIVFPPTTLVTVENTHNRSGGIVFPQAEAKRICDAARERDIGSYLDGARLWNAAVATGESLATLAAPFDVVGVTLSKGLGAPAGALLAGSRAAIARCHRYRRMAGGAMRQVGLLAAAGLYGLEHHFDGLARDHTNAKLMADLLAASPRIRLDPARVQTNILVFELAPEAPKAEALVAMARARGVLMFAFGPRRIRLVTHRDVSRAQCEQAAVILRELIESTACQPSRAG
jgi:threonine aldolase